MPKPSLRTRSRRRWNLRLPGGRRETHFEQKKIGALYCTRCGQMLSGVPPSSYSRLRKRPASQRRVERMYGCKLCHRCIRDSLKQAIRNV
ncbi:MAG: 50S ribosomal protein L34e [Candidatus Bathyarchaeota archaeon]|nr:MAG: 50S ribosomal protein L34e [Candidatus Bathyarchaeota archaeon]